MSEGAILLCGGRSSRMGRAKAWLPWRGRPMAAHVASVLAEAVDEVVVVSSGAVDPPPLALPARVVRDARPGLGPLAGLATGLAELRAERAFVTGTDAPFLTAAFVRCLLDAGREHGAAAPRVDGFVQTLAAAYPKRGAALAWRLLDAGRRRPLDLLEALDYRPLAAEELPDRAPLRGFNTPAEYLAAVAEVAPGAHAVLAFQGGARRLAGCESLDVPVGSLGEMLARAPGGLALCCGDRVAPAFLVSLDAHGPVDDARLPVGPGERVTVRDAAES